jgi:hypothetical protein
LYSDRIAVSRHSLPWSIVPLEAARCSDRRFNTANFCALMVHDGAAVIAVRVRRRLLAGSRRAKGHGESAE